MDETALSQLACLSHPQRLAIFRLLVRRYPDEVPAGEIVTALGLKPSTGSVYLGALTKTGLIRKHRIGTSLLYRATLPALRDLVGFLVEDCCQGRADLCPAPQPLNADHLNVVFLCTGNSARSLMAEAILRDATIPGMKVYSAGTDPYRNPNQTALKILQKQGHSIDTLRCKPLEEIGETLPRVDLLLTVCDRAANRVGPKWPGNPVMAHWGLPDPVQIDGDKKARKAAFQRTYDTLRHRIDTFAGLPLTQMHRNDLQKAMDRIATMEPT
ncbi:ArsR family transcriptional regulator [Primorskyibacter sp. 2E107]|uniref:arsenate reductase/protein-tyrosine-phosphatase family protein n=1 Tax=Primorskyibacter sp. 2E107 TaxID=3403458 RepID=UPI003AF964B6